MTICPPTPSRYHVSSHAFTLRIVHQRFHVTICTLPDALRCVQLALMFPHGRSLSAIFLYGEEHFQTQALPHAPGNVWQHREHLELSENVRERLPASGSLSEPLKISGSVWEHLGGSGRTWRSVWKSLGESGTSGNM